VEKILAMAIGKLCNPRLASSSNTIFLSGGPLQIVNSNNQCVFYLIGITSYGTPYCGMKNSPGIYSKVSAYIDWIEQKVW